MVFQIAWTMLLQLKSSLRDVFTCVPILRPRISTASVIVWLLSRYAPSDNSHSSQSISGSPNGMWKHHAADNNQAIHCTISSQPISRIITSNWTSWTTYAWGVGTAADHSWSMVCCSIVPYLKGFSALRCRFNLQLANTMPMYNIKRQLAFTTKTDVTMPMNSNQLAWFH